MHCNIRLINLQRNYSNFGHDARDNFLQRQINQEVANDVDVNQAGDEVSIYLKSKQGDKIGNPAYIGVNKPEIITDEQERVTLDLDAIKINSYNG